MINLITTGQIIACAILMLVAFLCTLAFTPVTCMLSRKLGAVDKPDGGRKKHSKPTPRLGGIAMMVGFFIAMGGALLFAGIGTESTQILVMLCGTAAICLIGVVDDIFNLPAIFKFICQILIATATAYFGGAITFTTMFGSTIIFGNMSIPITVVWIVVMINAMNLLDGLDGLACSVAGIGTFVTAIIAALMGYYDAAIVAAALCGAAIGFFPLNSHPAKVFMGDTGSMMLGYVVSCLSIFWLMKGVTYLSILVPALIFAFPLIDMFSVVFERTAQGKSIFKADRLHMHYKLMDLGLSYTSTVVVIDVATLIFGGCAILMLFNPPIALSIAAVVALCMILIKHAGKFIKPKEKNEDSKEDYYDGDENKGVFVDDKGNVIER